MNIADETSQLTHQGVVVLLRMKVVNIHKITREQERRESVMPVQPVSSNVTQKALAMLTLHWGSDDQKVFDLRRKNHEL